MKKWIIVLSILVIAVLVIPIPSKMKDGGTVHYNAILYDVFDIHRIQPADAPDEDGLRYTDGTIIRIFGIEVFNSANSACSHDHTSGNQQNDSSNPYFVGKVLEINEKGFLVEVTDTGNGHFVLGDMVQVNTELAGCTLYKISDHLRISFDGKVALSYPPQVTNVFSVSKTDPQGNPVG